MSKRFLIDVSTLIKWNRAPVGIVRALLETAKWYKKQYNEKCIFVYFSDDKSSLLQLSQDQENALLYKFESNNFETHKDKLTKDFVFFESLKNKIRRTKLFDVYKKTLNFKEIYGKKALLKKIILKLCPKLICLFAEYKEDKTIIHASTDINQSLFNPTVYIAFNDPTLLDKNDIYISCGLDWDHSNYELLYNLKKRIDFKFIGMCYDLIPITHPHFITSQEFSKLFFKHLYFLNYLSDKISCISNFSKSCLIDWRKENNLENEVDICSIYLGDDGLKTNKINSDLAFDKSIPKEFILYVSTIEARKNHVTLLKAYILAKQKNIELPDIIFVGMYGWGLDDFNKIINANPFLKNKIHILSELHDEKLNDLYEKTLFTVFPSFIEGWGLAAAESLKYGKICLISEAESLKEATQNLMPVIETENPKAWLSAIFEYSSNDVNRKSLEERIKNEFSIRTWENYVKDLNDFIQDDK